MIFSSSESEQDIDSPLKPDIAGVSINPNNLSISARLAEHLRKSMRSRLLHLSAQSRRPIISHPCAWASFSNLLSGYTAIGCPTSPNKPWSVIESA